MAIKYICEQEHTDFDCYKFYLGHVSFMLIFRNGESWIQSLNFGSAEFACRTRFFSSEMDGSICDTSRVYFGTRTAGVPMLYNNIN